MIDFTGGECGRQRQVEGAKNVESIHNHPALARIVRPRQASWTPPSGKRQDLHLQLLPPGATS